MFSIGIDRIQVTIVSGTSLSPAVPLGAKTLVGVVMPAAWDAAVLTFQAAIDDATYLNVASGGGADAAIQASASQFVQVDSAMWRGINELKVRSGPSGAPVNQTADRVITLVVRSNIT